MFDQLLFFSPCVRVGVRDFVLLCDWTYFSFKIGGFIDTETKSPRLFEYSKSDKKRKYIYKIKYENYIVIFSPLG